MRHLKSTHAFLSTVLLIVPSCSRLAFAFSPTAATSPFSRPLPALKTKLRTRPLVLSTTKDEIAGPLFSSTSESDGNGNNHGGIRDRLREATGFSMTALRTSLRELTGFSFTALRATLRGMTGISLTAIRVTVITTTSAFVRNTMKAIVGIFPTWFRYFMQPFLVLYYVPLIMIRGFVGSTRNTRKDRLAVHEAFVEHIKEAVQAAEDAQKGGYWPVHVNDDGIIVSVPPDPNKKESVDDFSEAIAESVEVAMSSQDSTQ